MSRQQSRNDLDREGIGVCRSHRTVLAVTAIGV